MKKQVTIWKRYDCNKKRWVHNHIQDGHSLELDPVPTSEHQNNAWPQAAWRGFHGFIAQNKVVTID